MLTRNRFRTLAVTGIALAGTVVGMSSAAAAGPTYPLKTPSGKCMTPYGGGTSNGTNIVQWDCNGSSAQQWWKDDSSRARHSSGKCIVPYGGSDTNGANIVLWDCNDTAIWWSGTGDYQLRSRSGKCVRPYGGSTSNGANMTLWYPCTG